VLGIGQSPPASGTAPVGAAGDDGEDGEDPEDPEDGAGDAADGVAGSGAGSAVPRTVELPSGWMTR
jgi:hypothetical protein